MQDSLGSLKQRDHFEDLGVDGRIIFKWILNYCMFYLVRCFSFINMKEHKFCFCVYYCNKVDLKGREWEYVDWFNLAQVRDK